MNAKILVIVEDEEDMRVLIRVLLTRDPRLDVLGEAASAEQAIELARTFDPGVIVLDHLIEGPTTGLEAAPALKEAAPNAKIVLFSAYDLAAEARRSPAVDAYLAKDEPQKLLPLVQQLLDLDPLAA